MNTSAATGRRHPRGWGTPLLAAAVTMLLVGGAAGPAWAAAPENDNFHGSYLRWTESPCERTAEVEADHPLAEATAERGEPNHVGEPAQQSIWFMVPPSEDGVTSVTWWADGPVRVAAYSGGHPPNGSLESPLLSLEEVGRSQAPYSGFTFRSYGGEPYYIAVDIDGDPTAVLRWMLVHQTKAPNDDFAEARPIGGRRGTSPYCPGSDEPGEPAPAAYSAWYHWTAPATGFTSFGVSPEHEVDVFTGSSLATVKRVSSGPRNSAGSDTEQGNRRSYADLWARQGQTYYIRVTAHGYGWGDTIPDEVLNWRPGTDYPAPAADFDRDGCEDLAVSAPGEDFGRKANAGAVVVRYGCSGPVEQWHQGRDGLRRTTNQSGDAFGTALAAGDFNADGYADLAIGVPGDRRGARRNVGGVIMLPGSASGLTTAGARRITQSAASGELSKNESGDRFGTALASRHAERTAAAELFIGVPGEDVGGKRNAGTVALFRQARVTPAIDPRRAEGPVPVQSGARLGASVAAGGLSSLPNDPNNTFVAGQAALDAAGGRNAGGVVHELSEHSLQDESGIHPRAGDRLGTAVAIADPRDGNRLEVAVGLPGRDVGGVRDAGMVAVFRPGTMPKLYTQAGRGVPDGPEAGDGFGSSLATGFFDGDTREDLLVGVPGEDVNGHGNAGAITTIFGGRDAARAFHLDSPGMAGKAGAGDRFGTSVGAVDVNGDRLDEVVAGAPYDDIRGRINAGSAVVRFRSGTSRRYDARLTPGGTEAGDYFGAALLQ